MEQTPGSQSDIGPDYRYKIITYIAASLTQNPDIHDFVIYSKLAQIGEFDNLILKLQLKDDADPYVYLAKIRHKSGAPLSINQEVNKYKKSFDGLMGNKRNISVLQHVSDDRIKFWFFCNNDVKENAKNIYDFTSIDVANDVNIPFNAAEGSCCRIRPITSTTDELFFDKFYLFLNQPSNDEIVGQIEKVCGLNDASDVAEYVKEYFKVPVLFTRGLTKANFETQLLKTHLQGYIAKPTNIVDVNEIEARIWNTLTLEHEITILDDVRRNIRHVLFACFVQKINDLFGCAFNWSHCLFNGGKLDDITIAKFTEKFNDSSIRQWVSPPQYIRSLIDYLWICNELPLILEENSPIPILAKFKHLNKKFIIISNEPMLYMEISSSFTDVFANASDIRTDELRNQLLDNITISFQGRTPTPLSAIIGSDRDCMRELNNAKILRLIRKRKLFLERRSLYEMESTIFIIEDEKSKYYKKTDKLEANENDTVVVYCRSNELNSCIEDVKGNPEFYCHSICRLRSVDNKLEFLEGDADALNRFFIDNWGGSMYHAKTSRPVPIIGRRLDKKGQVYMQRGLRKAILPNSMFKTQEKRICLMSGDLNSLDFDIRGQIIREDVDCNAKVNLENNMNVLIDGVVQPVGEYWDKFSSCDCPLFHVNVRNGNMELVNYRNCKNMSSYMAYSKETFAENVFFQEINSHITVIRGESGLGKSSLLHSLAEATDEKNYVLFCNLIDYRNDLIDKEELFDAPLDYIFNKFEGQLWKKLLYCVYKYHKIQGRLTLFIDSFDEVLPMERKFVLRFIEAIAKLNVRVIIASRLFFDTMLINNFEVQPIQLDDLSEIDYMTYFKIRGMGNVNLNDIPIEFLVNPLFLTFLWFLYRTEAMDFEQVSKFDMYRKIIHKKIEYYYGKSRQIYSPENQAQTNDILLTHRVMALVVVFGKDFVTQHKIIRHYEKLVRNFKVIKMKLGIIKRFNGPYAVFLHQSIAEFLAAEWLYQKLLDDEFDISALTMYKKMVLEYDINLRYLFDSMVCAKLKLHRAILEGNFSLVRELSSENDKSLAQTDKCGRNALLLVCSYAFDRNYDILEEVVLRSDACNVDFFKCDFIMKLSWFQYLDTLSSDWFFDRACNYDVPATLTKYLTFREKSVVRKNVLTAYENRNLDVVLALFATNPTLLKEFFLPVTKTAIEQGRLDVAYDLIDLNYKCNIVDAFKVVPDGLYLKEFVRTRTNNEFSALHLACMIGSQEIVTSLRRHGSNSAKDIFGNVSADYAVMHGKVDVFILRGFDAEDAKDQKGNTPLHLACRFLKDEFIEYVLITAVEGANVKNDKGETALHVVACLQLEQLWKNELKTVPNYLQRPAVKSGDQRERNYNKVLMRSHNFNKFNSFRDTFYRRVVKLVDTLLNAGAKIAEKDTDGNTPLHLAYRHNNRIVLEHLIEKSEEVAFIENADGLSVFEMAQREGKLDIVKFIQQHSSKIISDADISDSISPSETNEVSIRQELKYVARKGRALLHTAAINGRSDVIMSLLERGYPVDPRDDEGRTPLHFVRSARDAELLLSKYLVVEDAFLQSYNGETPLSTACRNGNTDVVRFLLRYNVGIETRDKYGQSPLHFAAMGNSLEVADALLKEGADVNAVDMNGKTALHLVIPKGSMSFLKLFLEGKANTSLLDNFGNTVLHLACQYGHLKLVEHLINESPNIVSVCNAEGHSAYHVACAEGKRDIVDFFLKKYRREELTITGDVLYKIIEENRLSVLKLLMEQGIPTKHDFEYANKEGDTLLHLASRKDHRDIMQILLEEGLNPNLQNVDGATPLHLVRSAHCAEMLLSKCTVGTNPHARTKLDETPLHMASCINTSVVRILLNANADVSSKDGSGWTPLHMAVWANRIDVVRLLLENGANVNATNNYTGTALHIAATKSLPLFREILDFGGDINAKNRCGDLAVLRNETIHFEVARQSVFEERNIQSVLDIACTHERHDIIKYLLENKNRIECFGILEKTLFGIVSLGDLRSLKMLFDENVISEEHLTYVDGNKNTVLHLAVMCGCKDTVSFLIERGADVNLKNNNSMTPLGLAAFKDQFDIIDVILASNLIGYDKETLVVALLKNNVKLVNFLFKAIDNIDILEALGLALFNGSEAVLDMLLNNDEDFNIPDEFWHLGFCLALGQASDDRIKELLRKYPRLKTTSIEEFVLFKLVEIGRYGTLQILFDENILTGNEVHWRDAEQRTPLHIATRLGFSDIIKLLVDRGAIVDWCDSYGYRPLHLIKSAADGHLLISKQDSVEVNVQTHTGVTPLHLASKNGLLDVVQLLLHAQADTFIQDENGDTPLHFAANAGHADVVEAAKNFASVVEVLLQNGADVDLADVEENTALHVACQKGHAEIIERLLDLSYNIIFSKNFEMYSPFEMICTRGDSAQLNRILKNCNRPKGNLISDGILREILNKGNSKVLQVLFEEGILTQTHLECVDADGNVPLHFAASKGDADIVRILLKNGADIHSRNAQLRTALHIAASNNFGSIIEILLENGADIKLRDNEGNTALHLAGMKGHVHIIERLLKLSHNLIFLKNVNNYSIFEYVCIHGTPEQVHGILETYVESNVRVIFNSALPEIVNEGDPRVLQLLLAEKILTQYDLEYIGEEGNTLLHFATIKGRLDIVQVLLGNGANVNATNNLFRTALHMASVDNLVDIIGYLLQNDADVALEDVDGNTALHLACQKGHDDAINLLISSCGDIIFEKKNLNNCSSFELACLHGTHHQVKSIVDKFNRREESVISTGVLFKIANKGDPKTLQLLLEENILTEADVSSTDEKGNTLLHIVDTRRTTDLAVHLSILKMVLGYDIDINSADRDGNTPLHIAVYKHDEDLVRILVEGGAEINAINKQLSTPLTIAAAYKLKFIIKFLLSKNADVNLADDIGNTALHYACIQDQIHVFTSLIKLPDEIMFRKKNLENRTPFETLCFNGKQMEIMSVLTSCNMSRDSIIQTDALVDSLSSFSAKTLQALLAEGVFTQTDLQRTDANGNTMLHLAVAKGNIAAVKFLLSNGVDVGAVNSEHQLALDIAISKGDYFVINILSNYH